MRKIFTTLAAVLSAVLAVLSGQCGFTQHEFVAVLIDEASKKPVPSARVILAPKKAGIHQCTIDTSLTGVSNERGEVRIPNLSSGEYVIFYNLSGSINPQLNGKVVTYGRYAGGLATVLTDSLGPLKATKGTMTVFDGHLSVANGELESINFDLRMTTTAEGSLLTVRVPNAGSRPVRIEIGPL